MMRQDGKVGHESLRLIIIAQGADPDISIAHRIAMILELNEDFWRMGFNVRS